MPRPEKLTRSQLVCIRAWASGQAVTGEYRGATAEETLALCATVEKTMALLKEVSEAKLTGLTKQDSAVLDAVEVFLAKFEIESPE